MKRLFISATAEADFEQAQDWYREQRLGLDAELTAEIERVFASITENPRAYPVLHLGVRRALPNRFPYKILFSEEEERIVVLAVRHQSQRPLPQLEGS